MSDLYEVSGQVSSLGRGLAGTDLFYDDGEVVVWCGVVWCGVMVSWKIMKIGCQPACPVIPGHTKPSSQEELVIYYVQLGISLLADTGVQSQSDWITVCKEGQL